jgi:hypothetical protein
MTECGGREDDIPFDREIGFDRCVLGNGEASFDGCSATDRDIAVRLGHRSPNAHRSVPIRREPGLV